MKLRDLAPLVLIAVLGGCSGADWDHAFTYVGIGGKDQQASPASAQPDASAGAVDEAPLPPAEDAAATRPWTPVGAMPPPSQTAMAEPVPPPPTAATEPVPASRPHVAASVPAFVTPPVAAAPEPARSEPQMVAAAAAPSIVEPPSAAPAPDSWCSRIAQSESADAASQGFDTATQRHRAEVAYDQCVRFGH
jgi:hypothetical protein